MLWLFMITLHNATLDKKILSQNEHGKESPSMWISACFLIWQLVFAVLPQVLHDQMSPSLITSSSTACFDSAYEESFSYTAIAMVFSVGCFLIFVTDFLTSQCSSTSNILQNLQSGLQFLDFPVLLYSLYFLFLHHTSQQF